MYLKIHINKAPSMPLNCQATFSEYSQLAKTQLKDMNETVEYLGLFGTTDYEDRLEDVRKVLHHFHSTNEIADIVLKACVFRRDYYNEIFLRDLLNLRDPSLTPVQIKFVDRLHSAGKVPHQMYANWELKP
ncbi:hypothetical protein M8J75_016325 [Diaphorina citri]|nr:hypothetical protein M8J75_016325 [Diaphorina citri]